MGTKWYKYLKEKIKTDNFLTDTGYAFIHGQVLFAYSAELITEKQKDELCKIIPEY